MQKQDLTVGTIHLQFSGLLELVPVRTTHCVADHSARTSGFHALQLMMTEVHFR